MKNGVGIQVVELNPIRKQKATKKRMKGKRESPEEECEEHYPEACRWSGNDFWTGDENFRRIVLQKTDLLGACQLFVSKLGLDPVPDGGRVAVSGLGLLSGAASCSQASLAHDGDAQQELLQERRKERCVAGEVRREGGDGGGLGVNSYSSAAIFISSLEIAGPS
jgi:hypothetical protein